VEFVAKAEKGRVKKLFTVTFLLKKVHISFVELWGGSLWYTVAEIRGICNNK
jgi:hypothetical protein